MDFITRYYKTLSENLQAQKENLLLEVRRRQAGTPVATASQFLNPGMVPQIPQQAVQMQQRAAQVPSAAGPIPGMEWMPQQNFSPIPQQTAAAPTPLNPARLPGMQWAQLTPQQNFSTRSQGNIPPTLLQNPTNPNAQAAMGIIPGPGGMPIPMMNPNAMPAPQTPNLLARDPNVPVPASPTPQQPQSGSMPQMGMIPGPGGRPIPILNPTQAPPTLLQDPNQFPQQASQQPNNFVEIDPTVPAVDPLAPPDLVARDPNVPVPTGPVPPAPSPPTTPGAAPTAAPAAPAAAAAFAGRGPMMSKKDQASYDKMVGDMMRARGMPVPMLRTGKGGNYQEWRSAVDARNAAMRDANIAITLRQNQLRDQQTLARQNRDAAKEAGDDAAVARYQQELSDINRARGNLNKDTGRYSLGSDTTSQGRIANDQLQASWKKKQDDFKARTGMDYDASNPQHTRIMQTPNMSQEAMQTALGVGEFNKNYGDWRNTIQKEAGQMQRKFDQQNYETQRAMNAKDGVLDQQFRKDLLANANNSNYNVGLASKDREYFDAYNKNERERVLRDEIYGPAGGKEAWEAQERARFEGEVQKTLASRKAINAAAQNVGGMPTNAEFSASPAGQQAELDRLRNLSGVPQIQAKNAAEQKEKDRERLAANYPALNMVGDAIRQTRNLPTTQSEQSPQTPAETLPEPSVNMTGNNISRARANGANTTPIQRATVTPPAPGVTPSSPNSPQGTRPLPPESTGGMNTPADINDPQANARRPRGRVVTAAARSMGPNSSAPRLS